jgi:hypothetical protein
MQIAAGEMKGVPRPPPSRPHLSLPFGKTTYYRRQQGERTVGDGLGEDIGGVAEGDPTCHARGDIDVVDADSHLRDDLQGRRLVEERSVDPIGEHAQETGDSRDFPTEDVGRDRPGPLPNRQIESLQTFQAGNRLGHIDTGHRSEAKRPPPRADNIG